jgi:hypothetical protein
LGLAASLAEDHIAGDIVSPSVVFVGLAFDPDDAAFLGVLEVIAMAFGDLPVDCLFHPGDLVDDFVAPFLDDLYGEVVFGVNSPGLQTVCTIHR